MSKEQPYIDEYIKAKKAGISVEWYYHDFESGKDIIEDEIPALLRVARAAEELIAKEEPAINYEGHESHWPFAKLDKALKEVEHLLE